MKKLNAVVEKVQDFYYEYEDDIKETALWAGIYAGCFLLGIKIGNYVYKRGVGDGLAVVGGKLLDRNPEAYLEYSRTLKELASVKK